MVNYGFCTLSKVEDKSCGSMEVWENEHGHEVIIWRDDRPDGATLGLLHKEANDAIREWRHGHAMQGSLPSFGWLGGLTVDTDRRISVESHVGMVYPNRETFMKMLCG